MRDRLKDLCDTPCFSLKTLAEPGTLLGDNAAIAATFVENHDVADTNPIINDKMLAYVHILTHEGYPCVFWQDYFNYNVAQEGYSSGIAALIDAHEKYAGGDTDILYVDDDLYIMQRRGLENKPGLIFVLNNSSGWNGKAVRCNWSDTNFKPVAWRGKNNTDIPCNQFTDQEGNGQFWAPPRGYVVYVHE